MGILSRFKDIMASNVHAIFNKEDKHPEQTIEKYLRQLRSDLGQVNAETEALKVGYDRAERAMDDNLAEQDKLRHYIEKCNDSGNTADARTFERKLERVQSEGEVLSKKYEQAKGDMDSLAAMKDKLSEDITTLDAKLSEIKGKLEAASQQEKMNKMADKAGAGNADEMFEKMNEKADYALDIANAKAELERSAGLSDYSEVESLASKYDTGSDDISE